MNRASRKAQMRAEEALQNVEWLAHVTCDVDCEAGNIEDLKLGRRVDAICDLVRETKEAYDRAVTLLASAVTAALDGEREQALAEDIATARVRT